ncbi:MAG TPA: zinc dependent phospholipase C family protein [Bacteroidota bacterium]
MKTKRFFLAVTLLGSLVFLLSSSVVFSWGFWAHKEVHRHAILALPEGPRAFFQHHADSIISRAVEPDLRRDSDSAETYFHYIDIDRYGKYPFAELPRDYDAAVKKFGKAYVDTTGTAAWRIADFTVKLSDAMKRDDAEAIQFYASYLGHYIADINVPLHSAVNYNGQFTNQLGIHSRWESRLPEKYGMTYKLSGNKAEYIQDPLAKAFDILLESSLYVEKVLSKDIEARKEIPEEKLYTFIQRDTVQVRVFSDAYYELYHKKLDGMVEARMNESIRWVASYWYTAWVNAGKPKLTLW